ncbi:hypothetical protein DFH09DRAFT_1288100 [Mycena vulgaris]|nr:hypothetical protein DFH09DRAFT_1288100 [Mycena vulgaris]
MAASDSDASGREAERDDESTENWTVWARVLARDPPRAKSPSDSRRSYADGCVASAVNGEERSTRLHWTEDAQLLLVVEGPNEVREAAKAAPCIHCGTPKMPWAGLAPVWSKSRLSGQRLSGSGQERENTTTCLGPGFIDCSVGRALRGLRKMFQQDTTQTCRAPGFRSDCGLRRLVWSWLEGSTRIRPVKFGVDDDAMCCGAVEKADGVGETGEHKKTRLRMTRARQEMAGH